MAPVNFVAGDSQQAGKLKEKEDEDDEEDKEERKAKHSSSSSADQRPNSESRTPLNLDSLRKKRNKVEVKRLQGVCTSQLLCSWEAHTKGIGTKLLLQMGFKPGLGLGKHLQGISAPVEARPRKGRGAIGAYGPEKKIKEEKKKDVINKSNLSKSTLLKTNLSKSTFNFSLPKLQQKLNVILDRCQRDVILNDHRRKSLHNKIITLRAEKINSSRRLDELASSLAVVRAIHPREPEVLIDLVEHWIQLPNWILEDLLYILVLKLTLEVEEWNPLTDTVPIHTWIHPWLPLLRNRLDTLIYPIIRRKFGSALEGWHPSDRSARLMLQPWAEVFSKGDMESFLVENIIPKLQVALSELVINPHQQHLDQWNWVYEWKDLIPVHIMAGLLDKIFFPKWLHILAIWLNNSPNYDQVATWYMGWKGMLNDKLLAEPIIKDHFKRALEMMNRAVTRPQVSLWLNCDGGN